MAVHAKERDTVTGLYTACAQRARQSSRAVGKFRVSEAEVSANDGGSAGILLLRVSQTAQGRQWNIHGLCKAC
jgi:hypothetical protein